MPDALPASAMTLLRHGVAVVADATGLVLLVIVAWQVLFGGGYPFEWNALFPAIAGAVACWCLPGARRWLPIALPVLALLATISAMANPPLRQSPDYPLWQQVIAPASHYWVMSLFVFGVAHLLRTPQRVSAFIVLLMGSLLVLAGQLLFDRMMTHFYYERGGSQSIPSVWQWGGVHQLSMLWSIAWGFLLAYLASSASLPRVVSAIVLVTFLAFVALFTGSTGGIAAMGLVTIAIAGVFLLLRLRRVWVRIAFVGAAAGAAALLIALLATGRVPLVAAGDLAGRFPAWRAATEMATTHPWTGVGPEGYVRAMSYGYQAKYYQKGGYGVGHAHGLLLQIAEELGIPGLLAAIALWLAVTGAAWRAWRRAIVPTVSCGLLFALIAFFIRAQTDTFLYGLGTTDRTRVLIWMMMAAAVALGRLASSGNPADPRPAHHP